MVRKYYCDYCDRSFPDNAEARRKHLDGAQHQTAVKLHYDSYRNPAEILVENARHPPCRKFLETGHCQFGLSCRYSHVPPGIDFSVFDPNLYLSQNPYLLMQQQPQLQKPRPQPQQLQLTRYKLPPGLPKDLPPSLRPPPPSGYDFSNAPQWG
ncbi:hypothetical protein G9A89_018450 [Geosiphon pyriformis]|nr:hypothetical protein G9A89_018450 [Geosiphon pyriformis]